jgi:cysteine desulfurase/selenocysteine lyase
MDKEVRSDFPVTRELTYLDTAYYGPYPLPVLQAGKDFLDRRSRGVAGRVREWLEVRDQVRATLAQLINAKPSEVAITTNTTEGTNIVATSLSLGRGDNVVWHDLDYPSNAAVWLNQERASGVENRVVKSKGGIPHLADFESAVDNRTKVISISYVSYRNGYMYDVEGLADLAHAHGAYLHVDAIQAIGAIRVDVKNAGIDFLTCGTYKWLLGPIGLAFFYVREELLPDLEPVFGGELQVKTWAGDSPLYPSELYRNARKFESATVHFQGVYELRAALDYINRIGMDKVEEQVLRLSSKVWKGLKDLGSELFTPPETRSGIVTCIVNDGQKTAQLLADNRIVVTVRGNEMRISPHFFNTEEEVDRLLGIMELAC